jgi:hypothetical protein
MKKILISFSNEKYYKSLESLKQSSLNVGKVDEFIPYTQEWLKTEPFWAKNQSILNRPRGAGYWIWKPYIILKTLASCEDGDVVMYTDAAVTPIKNLEILFKLAETYGKIIFQNAGHSNKTWTKRDCFVLMNCDEKKYWDGMQVTATFSLWKKNKETIDFLNEWLQYLIDPRIVTDDLNVMGKPNFVEFKEHRHDQSILSLMAIKYDIKLFRDPSQFGMPLKKRFTNSPYKQLFNHHRQCPKSIRDLVKEFIYKFII